MSNEQPVSNYIDLSLMCIRASKCDPTTPVEAQQSLMNETLDASQFYSIL